jgi:hypothetical protein
MPLLYPLLGVDNLLIGTYSVGKKAPIKQPRIIGANIKNNWLKRNHNVKLADCAQPSFERAYAPRAMLSCACFWLW